jgi:hypothetical protein
MTPHYFLEQARSEALPFDGPGIPEKVALRAIELAQEHSTKYREILGKALINAARSNQPQPSNTPPA